MIYSGPIAEALKLPKGARFFKCALQVNPFAYIQRHAKKSAFASESEYNLALVAALKAHAVEVIAITDHQRADTGVSLAKAAIEAGIIVFPGAELETKEGVHFLCLFDPDAIAARIGGILGDCGIHDQSKPPACIKYDVSELIAKASDFHCQFIAAHVAAEKKGLLRVLDNQARADSWKNPSLMACSLPGPVSGAPENLRPILLNKNADYRRDRPIAILNAQDISSPEDVIKDGSTCWIKMSEVSVQGLRQAFLDPSSRIRLSSDPMPEEHSEFVSLSWQGGFLDGASIHFNENLNVLIGGRGTGKSTVVESIRYALGLVPLGEEAGKASGGIINRVLRSGTKVSLLVSVHRPTRTHYLIERTIPNQPVVRDDSGNILTLKPSDVLQGVEIFGQHEISELSKSPERRTRLLDRFIEPAPEEAAKKDGLRVELETSRSRILEIIREGNQINDQLSQLPALEATFARYQKVGLEDKLKEQSLLVKEEAILSAAKSKLAPFNTLLAQLQRAIPVDRSFVEGTALDDLPNKALLASLAGEIDALSGEMTNAAAMIEAGIEKAELNIDAIQKQWDICKKATVSKYEEILRELQKSNIDGAEFIRLRRQIEDMVPRKQRLDVLTGELAAKETERRTLLVDWEDAKAAGFRRLEKAAKRVTRKLEGRVLVEVIRAGDRQPLLNYLDEKMGGRLAETKAALAQYPDLSISAFVEICRQGKDAIAKAYAIPGAQADRFAALPREILLEMEEIDLPATTTIKLNVAAEGQPVQWQTLEELSTGQKATALLLLLLLESQSPLVVDQPEDDLDNRFITEGIVPKMKEEKRCRQFVFATHNANIPVLGDAELIVGLSASGDGDLGKAKMPVDQMGAIDMLPVRQLVEEVLEGGKDAFEMRRLKYGF